MILSIIMISASTNRQQPKSHMSHVCLIHWYMCLGVSIQQNLGFMCSCIYQCSQLVTTLGFMSIPGVLVCDSCSKVSIRSSKI